MSLSPSPSQGPWVSLGTAARLLGVNQATLRHWADRGLVPVFRTAGQHRRFLREQITTLAQQGQGVSPQDSPRQQEEQALQRIRRRLRHPKAAQQSWQEGIQEGDRGRLRIFGRRLLSLLVQATPRARPSHRIMAEARLLGDEYGQEMASQGQRLPETVRAFLFFRDGALEVLSPDAQHPALALADQALLGVIEAHERTRTDVASPLQQVLP